MKRVLETADGQSSCSAELLNPTAKSWKVQGKRSFKLEVPDTKEIARFRISIC